jgi:hypothetical protein
MIQFAVLVKKPTLLILAEHGSGKMGGVIDLNETEALVMLSAEVITTLIQLANPEDERIDDVIVRLAL